MKKFLFLITVIIVCSPILIHSNPNVDKKEAFYITPYLTFNKWAPSFGGNIEILVTDKISLSGDILFSYWSQGENKERTYQIITPSISLAYYFPDISIDFLDVFIGIKVGYYFHENFSKSNSSDSETSSGLSFTPYTGLKCIFSKHINLLLALNFSAIGEFTGAAFTVGLSFKVN